jgi:hypothetical protein
MSVPWTFDDLSKETDSVLVRLNAALKTQATSVAEQRTVSANALYSAGVLYATVVYGELPTIGFPDNLFAFLDEIDRAVLEKTPVVGAFNESDWNEVQWILKALIEVAWCKDVRVRRDAKARSTIVYTFTMTRTGEAMFARFGDLLRARYSTGPQKQGSLFDPQTIAGPT